MRYHEFKSHAHRPRNATRICFIYQLWLINIIKACCISNIRTQIHSTFSNMSKNLCPQTGNGIVLETVIIFKMKVLVECSTTTFPYGSWLTKSIKQTTIFRHWSLPLFFHRFIQIKYNNNISKLWRRQAGLNRRPLQPLL